MPITNTSPVPMSLMGITDYSMWERFAIRTTVTRDQTVVEIVEMIGPVAVKGHSMVIVPNPGNRE